nr:MAG TPA: Guanylate kinase [Caudoviricetes sp.]
MLYLIVGASGSGKSYICNKICKDFNKSEVISRTTRQPRYKHEATHVFVSQEQANQELKDSIAKTVFDGNLYYVLKEDIQGKDLYVIDPNGVESLKMDKTNTIIIFLKVGLIRRIFNMKKRGDKFKSIVKRIINDRKVFKGFERKADVVLYSSDELYEMFKEKNINDQIRKIKRN